MALFSMEAPNGLSKSSGRTVMISMRIVKSLELFRRPKVMKPDNIDRPINFKKLRGELFRFLFLFFVFIDFVLQLPTYLLLSFQSPSSMVFVFRFQFR